MADPIAPEPPKVPRRWFNVPMSLLVAAKSEPKRKSDSLVGSIVRAGPWAVFALIMFLSWRAQNDKMAAAIDKLADAVHSQSTIFAVLQHTIDEHVTATHILVETPATVPAEAPPKKAKPPRLPPMRVPP